MIRPLIAQPSIPPESSLTPALRSDLRIEIVGPSGLSAVESSMSQQGLTPPPNYDNLTGLELAPPSYNDSIPSAVKHVLVFGIVKHV